MNQAVKIQNYNEESCFNTNQLNTKKKRKKIDWDCSLIPVAAMNVQNRHFFATTKLGDTMSNSRIIG